MSGTAKLLKFNITYRADIDGLRAIAALSVVLFHAGLPGFSGGFAGVDVFFVLSGYLITTIILRERAAGAFSLGGFYARRARRILPLVVCVVLVSTLFAYLWLLPDDLKDFAASVAGAGTFTLNFIAANNVGYFDRAAAEQPLLHLWSLAVEEQFYLLFPLFLMAIWWFGTRIITLILCGLLVAGIAAAEAMLRHDASAAFYLPHTRGWTILIGVLAAVWLFERPQHPNAPLATLGLGMILAALALLAPTMPYPGLLTLLPTVGTALVIVFCAPGQVVYRLLSLRPMVGLGLISFGTYLWHQPLFAFARYGQATPLPLWVDTGLIALTLILATVTWHLVEQPFRKGLHWRTARVLGGAGLASLGLIIIGVIGVTQDGLPGRYDAAALRILAAQDDRNPRRRICSSNGARLIPLADSCVLGDPSQITTALIGDSHADALSVPLDAALSKRGEGALQLTYSGCPLVPGLRQADAPDSKCHQFSAQVFNHLAATPALKTVIFHARFALYLDGHGYDNGAGGVEAIPPAMFTPTDQQPATDAARRAAVATAYSQAVQRLLDMGKRVIVVTSVPVQGWHVPRRMAFDYLKTGEVTPLTTSAVRWGEHARDSQTALGVPAPHPDLTIIHPRALLCDATVCRGSEGGLPLYADPDHLTNTAAARVVSAIME